MGIVILKFEASQSPQNLSILGLRSACLTSRPLLPARMASSNPKYFNAEEPYSEFKERFICAFNQPNLDGWWMRKYLQDLHSEDIIPEPDIVISILKACRRLNDIALAIRYLESLQVGDFSLRA